MGRKFAIILGVLFAVCAFLVLSGTYTRILDASFRPKQDYRFGPDDDSWQAEYSRSVMRTEEKGQARLDRIQSALRNDIRFKNVKLEFLWGKGNGCKITGEIDPRHVPELLKTLKSKTSSYISRFKNELNSGTNGTDNAE